jgi:hypothetical protein
MDEVSPYHSSASNSGSGPTTVQLGLRRLDRLTTATVVRRATSVGGTSAGRSISRISSTTSEMAPRCAAAFAPPATPAESKLTTRALRDTPSRWADATSWACRLLGRRATNRPLGRPTGSGGSTGAGSGQPSSTCTSMAPSNATSSSASASAAVAPKADRCGTPCTARRTHVRRNRSRRVGCSESTARVPSGSMLLERMGEVVVDLQHLPNLVILGLAVTAPPPAPTPSASPSPACRAGTRAGAGSASPAPAGGRGRSRAASSRC